MVPKQEIESRISRLKDRLSQEGFGGALLVYPIDVYYFTGTRQNAALWVPVAGDPVLLVRKSLSRATAESAINDVRPFPPSREFASVFPEAAVKIGLTFDTIPVQQFNYYAKLLPGKQLVDISSLNREIRSVKSAWEIDQLRVSGKRLCEVFARIPEILKPGLRELDLAAEIDYLLRKGGSEGFVRMRAFNQELFLGLAVAGGRAGEPGFFDGAVTGRGLSSAAPHGASCAAIERDVPVVIDYAGIWNGYIVDMTRIFVMGRLRPELQRAFEVSLEIQRSMAYELKPGAVCEELFARASTMAADAGLGGNFMGAPGENARFVGHGVGLELDEYPVLAQGFKAPLVAGQTIAVEPKFVFQDGVVGIENTFVVTAGGGENLTPLDDAVVFL